MSDVAHRLAIVVEYATSVAVVGGIYVVTARFVRRRQVAADPDLRWRLSSGELVWVAHVVFGVDLVPTLEAGVLGVRPDGSVEWTPDSQADALRRLACVWPPGTVTVAHQGPRSREAAGVRFRLLTLSIEGHPETIGADREYGELPPDDWMS